MFKRSLTILRLFLCAAACYAQNTLNVHQKDEETFKYKMENAYVASYIKHDEDEDGHNHAIIVLNNKAYFYGEVADVILSKK